MKILLNDSGFVESYAMIGNLQDGMEVPEPSDLDHFINHFTAYRLEDGGLLFCSDAEKAQAVAAEKVSIRERREKECFSVINRGALWYDRLTDEQRTELYDWYAAWLQAPDTLIIPDKPTFI